MNKKQYYKNNQGVTLIEMIVAVALFAVIMVSATGIFRGVLEGQRSAIASQNTQENIHYAMEVISKEVRQAFANPDDGSCSPSTVVNSTYNEYNFGDGKSLFFLNKNNKCIQYYLNNGILVRKNIIDNLTMDTTPDEIEISGLDFDIYDHDKDAEPGDKVQPRVTIKFKVNMRGGKNIHKNEFIMQTSVSNRYYRH